MMVAALTPEATSLAVIVAAVVAGLVVFTARTARKVEAALPPAELRTVLGYGDYDAKAKPFIVT